MDLARLILAVKTRLVADTAAGGLYPTSSPLCNGAPYFDKEPPAGSVSMPYLVLACAIGTDNPQIFAGDICNADVEVHLFVSEDDSSGDPWATVSAIETRIKGDSSAGGAPSVGLHRHPLTLSGGTWTADRMLWRGTERVPEDLPVVHYRMFFTVVGRR